MTRSTTQNAIDVQAEPAENAAMYQIMTNPLDHGVYYTLNTNLSFRFVKRNFQEIKILPYIMNTRSLK